MPGEPQTNLTLFEDLVERFGPPMEVAPWGLCLTVQGPEFDMAWVKTLVDLRYSMFLTKLDEQPVVFIPCKKSVAAMSPTGSESLINEVCNLENNDEKEETLSPETKITVDQSNVLLDLVQKYQILSEGYQSLSNSYVELKSRFDELASDTVGELDEVAQKIEESAKETVRTNREVKILEGIIFGHKHAISGEAMQPLERTKS